MGSSPDCRTDSGGGSWPNGRSGRLAAPASPPAPPPLRRPRPPARPAPSPTTEPSMPLARINDLDLYYERSGVGPRLLFLNGSGVMLEDSRLLLSGFHSQFDLLAYDQ